MDWMIWAILLQQQAQAAEAERQRQEAAAKKKAEEDAAAAAAAEATRQSQIAQQRQTEAAAAQQDEAARQAVIAGREAPIAPADSYSPVGGSFYGSGVAKSTAQNVGAQQAMDSFASAGKKPAQPQKSALGDMFGDAYVPQAPRPASSGSSKSGGSSAGSYSIF